MWCCCGCRCHCCFSALDTAWPVSPNRLLNVKWQPLWQQHQWLSFCFNCSHSFSTVPTACVSALALFLYTFTRTTEITHGHLFGLAISFGHMLGCRTNPSATSTRRARYDSWHTYTHRVRDDDLKTALSVPRSACIVPSLLIYRISVALIWHS